MVLGGLGSRDGEGQTEGKPALPWALGASLRGAETKRPRGNSFESLQAIGRWFKSTPAI